MCPPKHVWLAIILSCLKPWSSLTSSCGPLYFGSPRPWWRHVTSESSLPGRQWRTCASLSTSGSVSYCPVNKTDTEGPPQLSRTVNTTTYGQESLKKYTLLKCSHVGTYWLFLILCINYNKQLHWPSAWIVLLDLLKFIIVHKVQDSGDQQ